MDQNEGLAHLKYFVVEQLAYLLRVGSEQVPDVRLPVETSIPATEIEARLSAIDKVVSQGPFQPNWNSLSNFKTPQWYQDGKFGIFIHWGLYSVPAFGSEWYPRQMYIDTERRGDNFFEHHRANYGPQSRFGYKDFIPMFKAAGLARAISTPIRFF